MYQMVMLMILDARIPKLAEEALYAYIIYSILSVVNWYTRVCCKKI